MRNVILSAFPNNITPPEPFSEKLIIDNLEESKLKPIVKCDYETHLKRDGIIKDLDQILSQCTVESAESCKDVIQTLCTKLETLSEKVADWERKSIFHGMVLYLTDKILEMDKQQAPVAVFSSGHLQMFLMIA